MANKDVRIVPVGKDIDASFLDPMEKWSKGPDFKTIGKLEAVLAEAFAATQAEVHIITGSLKLSGKTDSDYDGARSVWKGTISYGGETEGPKNPVRYATYEKHRGDAHDFMRSIPDFYPDIETVLNEWMSDA